MAQVAVIFDGAVVGGVTVPDPEWNRAVAIVGDVRTASKTREAVAVAKLLQAGLACASPTHESHDVVVTIAGDRLPADIKTLFPSFDARQVGTSAAVQEDIVAKIDSEVLKENRQGTICLFDLSYLSTAVRQGVVGGIHNLYPTAITLEYDFLNAQLHVIRPTKFEFHRGNWYH
ncbi:MAG TPA: hypothetical protein VF710_07525 [Longimicrobium sp.]|jgi:hypothetical protein